MRVRSSSSCQGSASCSESGQLSANTLINSNEKTSDVGFVDLPKRSQNYVQKLQNLFPNTSGTPAKLREHENKHLGKTDNESRVPIKTPKQPESSRQSRPITKKWPRKKGKEFPCPICNKVLATKFSLLGHVRIHTNVTPFECKMCNAKFQRHIAEVHIDRTLQCEISRQPFTLEAKLREHENKHIGKTDNESRVPIKTPKQPEFSRQSRPITKKLPRKKGKEFPCPICNKVLATKFSLLGHVRIHTNVTPFECKMCNAKISEDT